MGINDYRLFISVMLLSIRASNIKVIMKFYFIRILLLIGIITLYTCQSRPANSDVNNSNSKTSKIYPTPIYGIDISKYQGDEIDLINSQKDSLAFVICKATEGVTYTDPKFRYNWEEILNNKFIRGAYHFYKSDDLPEAQVKHYLETITDLLITDFPPIIDVEEGSINRVYSIEQIQKDLLVFLSEIERKLNRRPIIYTNIYIGNKYLNKSEFSNYPIWIANYTQGKHPELPDAWENTKWILWQKSDNYEIESITNDFDIFNGDLIQLQEFIIKSQVTVVQK